MPEKCSDFVGRMIFFNFKLLKFVHSWQKKYNLK